MMTTLIIALVTLALGIGLGFCLFRYVATGKYKQMLNKAEQEANVIKEKKLLEVKEKFLNKKAELEKEVAQRNQRIQQVENKLKLVAKNVNSLQEAHTIIKKLQ